MNRSLTLAGAILTCAALTPVLHSQDLYSHAVNAGNSMRITLKMRQGASSSTYSVFVSGGVTINMSAPGTLTTDSTGYGALLVTAVGTQNNCAPEAFTVTFSGSTGTVTRDYLLHCVNGSMSSAWPDFLMIQGAFCGPSGSESAHLQIDRTADLDGDGLYGDVVAEAGTASTEIDYPGEFSADVNTQGTNGCVGGVAPGVFQPGGGGRQVAFLADNRSVTGPCNFTTAMNFLQDMSYGANLNGAPAILAVSSGSDTALICRDSDGSGSITAAEIGTFFDPSVAVNNENYSPDGIAWDPTATNRAYWVSDKSGALGSPTNQGILQLTDANGDDSISSGEVVHTLTGSTPTVLVEGIPVDTTEFETVHCDGAGGVLVNHTSLGTIFRWVDGNGDGVAQTGEVANWLTYNNGGASAYSVNADFSLGGTFPSYTGFTYFAMNLIESVSTSNGEVYFVASTNSSGNDAGYVFRCEDFGGDGSVNDLGDVTVFVDPALMTDPLGFPYNWSTGLDAEGVDSNGNGFVESSEVYVYGANPNGPKPNCGFTGFGDLQVWRFHDMDFDGAAASVGEHGRVAIHPTGAYNRGLEVVPQGAFRNTFYARSSLHTVQAANCLTPTFNQYMEVDHLRDKIEEGTQGTPFAGNARFVMLSRGNLGGFPSAGFLLAPMEQAPPLSFPIVFGLCTLGLSGTPLVATPPVTPDSAGTATLPLSIPTGVVGTIYVQPYNFTPLGLFLGEVAALTMQ